MPHIKGTSKAPPEVYISTQLPGSYLDNPQVQAFDPGVYIDNPKKGSAVVDKLSNRAEL